MFFEKINKMDKHCSQTGEEKIKGEEKSNIRNEGGAITTDSTDIKRIREYHKELETRKFYRVYEMDKFLVRHKPLTLTQEEWRT